MMTRNARRIIRLMEADPHCHWCGVEVIYYTPAWNERVPLNFATIDHFFSRFTMQKRLEAWRESMKRRDGSHYTLACWECNQKRAVDEAKERSRLKQLKKSRLIVPDA